MSVGFPVVCAGIVVVDHIAAPIERVPAAGQLVLTDDCLLSIGGCASNVAVDLAKMGVKNTVAGCIGNDLFGEFARRILEQHGVDTSQLTVTDAAPTSQTLIVNVKGEDRRFIHLPGASRVFSAQHLPTRLIEQAKVLYVGGYFLMESLDAKELAAAFRAARSAGARTVLDVVTPGPRQYMDNLAIVLPETDVFLPNSDESTLMSGERDPVRQAQIFRSLGANTVVITCGGGGAALISEKECWRSGVFPVTFVDGTGGGDAFDAGFICGLLEGAPLKRCLALGSALGASCVRQSGATDGVFTRQQADKFLAENALPIVPIS